MIILGGVAVTLAVYTFSRAHGFQDLFWCSVGFGIGGGIAMPALTAAAVMQGGRIGAMGSAMALLTRGPQSGHADGVPFWPGP